MANSKLNLIKQNFGISVEHSESNKLRPGIKKKKFKVNDLTNYSKKRINFNMKKNEINGYLGVNLIEKGQQELVIGNRLVKKLR